MEKAGDKFPCFLDSDNYFLSEEPTHTMKFSTGIGEKLNIGIWIIIEVLAGCQIAWFLGHSL